MFKYCFEMVKVIVKQLAIAFFFSSILIFGFYFIFSDDLNLCINLLNKMTVVTKKQENEEIHLDTTSKRLINYPAYGTIYATLKIPAINVEAPVYHGDSLDLIKKGIGHYPGSYFPGEGSSIVLAAHNSKEHFMYLPKLKEGDEIILDTIYGTYTYQMISSKIIKDTDTKSLPIQTDEEILMMYTCYPVATIGHKSKRYVVYARLVGDNLWK